MGAIQVTDELQGMIERQVAEGRAESATAFLEEAVRRPVEEARLEEAEIVGAAQAGIADIEAGRFTTVGTSEDGLRVHQRWMANLHDGLAVKE